MATSVLGLDIGGANLKAAHSSGVALLQPYALWKNPAGLPAALVQLIQRLPPYDQLAVTMTGELCDCFESKRQGVSMILHALEALAEPSAIRIWCLEGRFLDLDSAHAAPLSVAAADWLALAAFAGRFANRGPALLLDIGSTTTDIVPLCDGRPVPRGRSDPERLHCRELVYTGVSRTPVCVLLGAAGAAEFFATTKDVYLILGDLPEEDCDRDTADGRPATRAAAHGRLARMVCADRETCSERKTRRLALRIRNRQLRLLRRAVRCVSASLSGLPDTVITAGSGEFLAERLFRKYPERALRRLSLAGKLGPIISQAACAFAVAMLAAESSDHEEKRP
jgi:(4-(4-[2-(gamma-L-glutamylamino)ethyl]phenoxymethyl)furan-2-yl)methanamine synthase